MWLDKKLDPKTHIENYKPKINYLINRFKITPKRSVTPKFIINLWTLIIRPVFDYSFCLAKLKNKSGEKSYLELQSIKKLMSFKKSTSNQLIKGLIGYDPKKLCEETIRRTDTKWIERKRMISVEMPPIDYRIRTDNLLITWNTLWYNNLLYSECKTHHVPNTPEHIRTLHSNYSLPNLMEILNEGYEVHNTVKKRDCKKRCRIYKFVQKKIEVHEKVTQYILNTFIQK